MNSKPDIRNFFETMVLPAYRDFLDDPLAQHKAKASVIYLNDLAERVFHYLGMDAQFPGRLGPGNYRSFLAEQCPDIGLIRDIADGQRHYRIERSNRRVSSAEQSNIRSLTLDEVEDFDAIMDFDDIKEIMVELDNGAFRSLRGIVTNSIEYWTSELKKLNV